MTSPFPAPQRQPKTAVPVRWHRFDVETFEIGRETMEVGALTTAVQAIDRLHDLLRQLARRPFPSGDFRDGDGTVRLRVPTLSWDDYVHLAFDEIRLAGAGSPQVARRLNAAIDDLISIAPPDRKGVLEQQRSRLQRSSDERLENEGDRIEAKLSDMQGIGGASQ